MARWSTWKLAAAVMGLACLWSGEAQAQYTNPYANLSNRPAVSPYLNLLRRDQFGISPYHTLVRPQLEEQASRNQQQQQIQDLQRQFQTAQAVSAARTNQARISATGHPTRFLNYIHYYPTLRAPFAR